jgi:hypothetical protein
MGDLIRTYRSVNPIRMLPKPRLAIAIMENATDYRSPKYITL